MEEVSRACALIHQKALVRDKDIRKFLDGPSGVRRPHLISILWSLVRGQGEEIRKEIKCKRGSAPHVNSTAYSIPGSGVYVSEKLNVVQ